jgi:hypothetical protein
MVAQIVLVAHIAVLGYWLGSEFVINSTYRYVCYAGEMPFADRDRLMGHVMNVDQHVRYALVLQFGLGFALAALYGFIPGGATAAWIIAVAAAAWFVFVEIIHHIRHSSAGRLLATFDRRSRYFLMGFLLLCALTPSETWNLPFWLRVKLALFAGVIASGVGIRLALLSHFRTWAVMARDGPSDETNAIIRRTYWKATSVLLVLWLFIAGIVTLSIWKPG